MIRASSKIDGVACLETRDAEGQEEFQLPIMSTSTIKLNEFGRPSMSSRPCWQKVFYVKHLASVNATDVEMTWKYVNELPFRSSCGNRFATFSNAAGEMPILPNSNKKSQKIPSEALAKKDKEWKKGSAVTLRTKGRVLKARVAENSVGNARALPSLPCVPKNDSTNPFAC